MRVEDMIVGDVLALGCYLGVRDTINWFNSGRYRKRLAGPDGELLRFVTLPELARRLDVRPAAVQWWIACGKLKRSNGLVPCNQRMFVDMKKFHFAIPSAALAPVKAR
ncbi:MAG: hypothetical protein ACREQN_07540 [Candidatus Binataceae bacterium]